MRTLLRGLVLVVALPLPAQQDPGLLTVDRMHSDPTLHPRPMAPMRWLDGHRFTVVQPHPDGGDVIGAIDARTMEGELLVGRDALTPTGGEPLEVEEYEWSEDDRYLLVFTNTRRVWRENTRGDYWVLDTEGGSLRRLAADREATWTQFAKFSPDSEKVGYVHQNDIFVEDLATGAVTRITDDGSETIVNGTFDWVYEEEFHIQDGWRWSPNSESIAFWQLDTEGVGTFLMIDNLSGQYAETVPVQYPKVGTRNSACRIGVVSAEGGEVTWMQTPGDLRNHYLARMEWAPRGGWIAMQHLDRPQQHLRVLRGDAATGEVSVLYEERDDAWIDVRDDFRWLDDGASFLWVSERDGWRHAWRVPTDAGEPTLITRQDDDLLEVVHVDEDGGWLMFEAAPENATQRHLFRCPLDGGPFERLTPEGAAGTHDYDVSPDGTTAIHTSSTFGSVPVYDVVRLPGHEQVRMLNDNGLFAKSRGRLDHGGHEFFQVEGADGAVLDGWVMYPPDFDPERRWPVLFYVYGETWAQTVLDSHAVRHHLWHLLVNQRGYVVISLDNRGTPAAKGREWRKCVHGEIGVISSRDQAAALANLKERWSWIDGERIGIWGWSGGGAMTLNMLFRYPEAYHVGIAVAFISDQRLYDTIYQERYSGLLDDNPEGYRRGSPITHAENLEGDLLLIHGTADDNVHYQNLERLVDELIAHDKPFQMMAYPGRSHSIHEGRNTRRHLRKTMLRFLLDELPAGPR